MKLYVNIKPFLTLFPDVCSTIHKNQDSFLLSTQVFYSSDSGTISICWFSSLHLSYLVFTAILLHRSVLFLYKFSEISSNTPSATMNQFPILLILLLSDHNKYFNSVIALLVSL